ncbi:MAG: hypothetical protein NPIRA05_02800 [Nitrospirales bacterium]|nr:MAG: hypothetical protein NPIRA05_02800 [Nitrospirales bacterium]
MDNGSLWIWIILIVGLVVFFMWMSPLLKKSEDERNRWSTLKKRILGWFQAVDQEEVLQLRQQLESQCTELSDRLDRLELTLTQQGRLENWATEVNSRLCQLELSKESHRKQEAPRQSHSKSILCLGVRVTLTDQIWHGLGKINPQDLSDLQIRQYIQGPFCRNCLRSLVVGGVEDGEKSVRAQCRYCSLVWRKDSNSPLPLGQVKREVYDYLDTAYRHGDHIEL